MFLLVHIELALMDHLVFQDPVLVLQELSQDQELDKVELAVPPTDKPQLPTILQVQLEPPELLMDKPEPLTARLQVHHSEVHQVLDILPALQVLANQLPEPLELQLLKDHQDILPTLHITTENNDLHYLNYFEQIININKLKFKFKIKN